MDPSAEIHRAVRLALISESTVTDVIPADRVFDSIDPKPVFPYIKVSVDDATEDDDGCGRSWRVAVNVHTWSRAVGTIQTKQINASVRTALDGVSSVTGFDLNFVQFAGSRVLEETDGRTTHGVVTYEFGVSEV
jgi:hypothetical protein